MHFAEQVTSLFLLNARIGFNGNWIIVSSLFDASSLKSVDTRFSEFSDIDFIKNADIGIVEQFQSRLPLNLFVVCKLYEN